ncbi:hypothetical protein IAT40_002859 [Kwoniella sp. CBS 6097]
MSRQSIKLASSSSQSQPIRPHPLAPYHPPADTATYRDLLLFEERLKSNAEMLRKRRQRYNIFLWTFVASLFTMGYRLLVQPPTSLLKLRALQASVAVLFITLALFFASGMYQEKIRYAHSYINHSNKALRPLNMHLNMRRPKTAFFSYIPFLASTKPVTSPQPFLGGTTNRKVSGTPNVMATIPPSSNPRGELIFSSRVDKAFREGYERYRAAFERRREEKARGEKAREESWYHPFRSRQRSASPAMTPPLSRKETPSGSRQQDLAAAGTAVSRAVGILRDNRERSESYSFVLNQRQPSDAGLGALPRRG